MRASEWIRRGLREPGKTQRGLARALNIDPSGVSRLLKDERQLRADEMPKVRAYLGDPGGSLDASSIQPEEPDHPPLYTGNLEPGIIPIDNTDYASLQRFDAGLSAGPGSLLEAEPEPLGYHLVEAQWLRAITSTAPKHLMVVMVDGDSMEPTLSHQDWVLVDTTQRRPSKQAVFALRVANEVWVKRVQPMLGKGLIRLHSDNTRYDPDDVTEDQFEPIGRVIAIVARKL